MSKWQRIETGVNHFIDEDSYTGDYVVFKKCNGFSQEVFRSFYKKVAFRKFYQLEG